MSLGYWLLITFAIMFVTSIGLSIWDSIAKERQRAENGDDEEGSESEDYKEYTADSKPERKKRHSGRCDGDCANCPAHYGYRYGRWYYGHSHTEGCEFGGNKCNGGRD